MSTVVFISFSKKGILKKPVNLDLQLQAQSELISFYSNKSLYTYLGKLYLVCGALKYKTEYSETALVQYLSQTGKDPLAGQYLGIEYSPKDNKITILNDPRASIPLYILDTKDALYLSTQPSLFRSVKNYKPHINTAKIPSILSVTFSDAEISIVKDVSILPKGSCLEIAAGLKTIKKYFSSIVINNKISFEEATGQLRQILLTVIAEYLQIYKNPASELSGGVDSACVSGALHKLTNSDCKTFSISFSQAELDEGKYREDFKTKHSLTLAEFSGKIMPLEYYRKICQQLFMWPDFPNSSMSRFYLDSGKSAGIDLLLSGFGGDHLFSGKKFYISKRAEYLSYWRGYREYRASCYYPILKKKLVLHEYEKILARQREIRLLSDSSLKQMIYYLLNDPANDEYLRTAQLSANCYGITRLHPLFDQRVVDYTLSLPENFLESPKKLLKEAFCQELPDSIIQRQDKTDFSRLFYETLVQSEFRQVLKNALERFEDYLNVDYCNKIVRSVSFNNYNIFSLWNLAALEILAESFDDYSLSEVRNHG